MSLPKFAGPPLWLLALIALSGTLAMHIFIPALPQAARELGAASGTMQLTTSFYIGGLAIGQLLYGPVADRIGRRPVLLAGMALYVVASFAGAAAHGAQALIVTRLAQALGGCAGLVLGRTIVRDISGAKDSTQRLALLNLMVSLGPSLAPIAGTALMSLYDWRAIFLFLGALGALLLVLVVLMLPETRPQSAGSAQGIGRDYRTLFRSPRFLCYAVGGGCATTSFYAFISAAPFLLIGELHQSRDAAAIDIALIVFGLLAGSATASLLAPRMPARRLLAGASLTSVCAAAATLAILLSGHLNVPALLGLMFVYAWGMGTASPVALAEALGTNSRVIASASGLYGFVQMSIGALCTTLAGLGHDRAISALIVLIAAGIVAQICFRIAIWSQPQDPVRSDTLSETEMLSLSTSDIA